MTKNIFLSIRLLAEPNFPADHQLRNLNWSLCVLSRIRLSELLMVSSRVYRHFFSLNCILFLSGHTKCAIGGRNCHAACVHITSISLSCYITGRTDSGTPDGNHSQPYLEVFGNEPRTFCMWRRWSFFLLLPLSLLDSRCVCLCTSVLVLPVYNKW